MGKVKRPKPSGAFVEPRNGGEYWRCPSGFKRTIFAVTSNKACEKVTPARTLKARAVRRGAFGCPSGAFKNGLEDACYVCPAPYRRSVVPGKQLHKMNKACVHVKVDGGSLGDPAFVRWAKKDLKKFKHAIDPVAEQAKRFIASGQFKKIAEQLAAARSKADKERIATRGMETFRRWMRDNGPKPGARPPRRRRGRFGVRPPSYKVPKVSAADEARRAAVGAAMRLKQPNASEVIDGVAK